MKHLGKNIVTLLHQRQISSKVYKQCVSHGYLYDYNKAYKIQNFLRFNNVV